MIIVNQDKEIINFDNVTRIFIEDFLEDGFGIGADTNSAESQCWDLGCYKTEERAKEVLQEIVSKYSSYLKLEGGPAILQGQMDIQPNIFNIPKVYEMPTE